MLLIILILNLYIKYLNILLNKLKIKIYKVTLQLEIIFKKEFIYSHVPHI